MGHRPTTGVTEADLLLDASRALRRTWTASLTDLELTPHESRALRVVVAGAHCEPGAGAPRLADVAGALRIAPRSATEVIDRLQTRGLVERRPSATDRRAVEVAATPSGLALHARIEESWRIAAREFLTPLDGDEREQLAALLRRLLDA